MDNSKVRYAVIGAGNIAQVAVLPSFKHSKESSELVALVSGDAEKRAELGKRYDLELTGDYAELEQLLARAAVDAVYVATPNALHKEHAIRAAKQGVHVLCEKTLATSVADCEQRPFSSPPQPANPYRSNRGIAIAARTSARSQGSGRFRSRIRCKRLPLV